MQKTPSRLLRFAPFLLTLLAILLAAAVLPNTLQAASPLALLPCVYFWAFFRPARLPVWAVFLLALLTDVLMALPLGATALPSLLLYVYVTRRRDRYGRKQAFLKLWQDYALSAAAALLLLYLLLSAYYAQWFPPKPVLIQAIITLLLYAPLHGLFFPLLKMSPVHGDR